MLRSLQYALYVQLTCHPPSDVERNATVDFKGEKRGNETHQSTTDPDARLHKKGDGDKSRLCYLGQALTRVTRE